MTSLVLAWPLAAALTPVTNRYVLFWSIVHVVLAFFVARGVAFDLWGWPDFRDDFAVASSLTALPFSLPQLLENTMLGVVGIGIWISGLLYSRSAKLIRLPKNEPVPTQLGVLLCLVGLWVTGGGFGHDGYAWSLEAIGTGFLLQWLLLVDEPTWVEDSASSSTTGQFGVLRHPPPTRAPIKGADKPEQAVVGRSTASWRQWPTHFDDEAVPRTGRYFLLDNGSPEAASQRELAALRRAAVSQWLADTAGHSAEQDEHRQAHWAALDDAKRWALTLRARVKQAMQDSVRPEGAAPAPPLTKNVLPALLPLTYPADFRALERWALRVGASLWLPGRPIQNPGGEHWSAQRIDNERPALALPEAAEAWFRTRALLWPESWPTDDDWVLEDESPDLLLRHPDAQFAIVKDGVAAIPARLVDVADLRMLEQTLAVEGAWTARQSAGQSGAGAGEQPMLQIADADRRLIARHAFRIGSKVWFNDGTESNPNGERWAQETIDARLPPLSVNWETQTIS